jgi:hypothetical protein
MSFEEFVRFLRRIEKSDETDQIVWSFLLYEEDRFVFPGSLMRLGQLVAPVLHDEARENKIEDDENKVQQTKKKQMFCQYIIFRFVLICFDDILLCI